MNAMACQITGVSIVYSTVCRGADHRKHQSSASLAFAREIDRWPVDSPHKEPVTRKMFAFDDVITSNPHSLRRVVDVNIAWLHTRYQEDISCVKYIFVNCANGMWRFKATTHTPKLVSQTCDAYSNSKLSIPYNNAIKPRTALEAEVIMWKRIVWFTCFGAYFLTCIQGDRHMCKHHLRWVGSKQISRWIGTTRSRPLSNKIFFINKWQMLYMDYNV